MTVASAGLLLYRIDDTGLLEVWLVHPGGPYWAGKDDAAWSVPKGEYGDEEEPRDVALREFEEECGFAAPDVPLALLGRYKQPSGKIVSVYTGETTTDLQFVSSNMFDLEWPPKSGTVQQFPEVDAAQWWSLPEAEVKLHKGQRPILEGLRAHLDNVGSRYRTE